MPDYRVIARVVKAHGKKGEVVTVPVHGLPSLMHAGLSVCIVPPRLNGPRWRKVESVGSDSRGELVKLSGIDDLNAADALVDRFLLVKAEDLPADIAFLDREALIGRSVEDEERGSLGEICEVMYGPANDVWVIRGSYGEVLLPVIPDVVDEIPASGPIMVHAPAGTIQGGI